MKENKTYHTSEFKDDIQYNQVNEIMIPMLKHLAKEIWSNIVPDAKYKMGEIVFFKHHLACGYEKIIGINNTGDGIEYCLDNLPFLLWEEELQKDER